ncbi:MAG: hypothetical protein HQ581_09360 [Planctomycetes bacterium]|nr:hypothetical protein [Planctomycetota bacterium]
MKDLTLHQVPYNHLYADLSYRDFFQRYYPHRDGRVFAATYSFNHAQMDFWWRLEPTSTLYIDRKYTKQAQLFLRRFPLFEIYVVSGLHTKAVFFERSGVLLIGSENIYKPESSFFEATIETVVPEADRQKVIELVFGRLNGSILTAKYKAEDIRIHANNTAAAAHPFLPCHREVPYWDIIGPPAVLGLPPQDPNPLPTRSPPKRFLRWVYHIKEYNISDQRLGLAFDRGYVYCGDLDSSALDWFLANCEVKETKNGCGAIEQSDSTMLKDRFYRYHPVARSHTSVTDYWLGPVKNPEAFSEIHETLSTE